MFFFSFSIRVLNILQLRFEPDHLGKFRPVLIQSLGILLAQIRLALEAVLQNRALSHGGKSVVITRFGQLINGLFADPIGLRFRQLAVEVGELLRGDVLLFVQGPDLIVAFVFDPGVFGGLHLGLQFIQLVRQPIGGLSCGFVAAAEILLDEIVYMRIDDERRQLRVRGRKRDVQQPAVGHAFDRQSSQKRSQGGGRRY